MKALVLAAGKGKRLESHTRFQNKCMLEYNGKPILENLISDLSGINSIREIVIVVGYRAEEIINYFGNRFGDKKIIYAIQRELKGLVNAIECAGEYLEGDDFFLALGDEIMINPQRNQMITEFYKQNYFVLLGAVEVRDQELIKKTYTLVHDEKKQVYRLIEKPRKPLNHLMGTGNVIFKNSVFDYIEHTPVHPTRGEKELPDLIQVMIDNGYKVGYFNVCDVYHNVNTIEDFKAIRENFKLIG